MAPPVCPDCGEEFAELARPIVTTTEHRLNIDRAIAEIRACEGDAKISEGRAVELVCANFVAGNMLEKVQEEAAQEEAADEVTG